VTQIGACYSTTITTPNISNSSVSYGSSPGVGIFTVNLTGLNAGSTYYYRTFAKNGANPNYSYSSPCVLITQNAPLPTVTTSCPSTTTITSSSAIVSGSVSQTGGFTISERGFCYSSTNSLPTVTNASFITSGTGTGVFTSTLSGLNGCTTYYVRAYAKNSANAYGYGPVCPFTTLSGAPTLTSPTSGTVINTSQYIFYSWSGVSCATGYQIQISRSSTFNQSTIVNIPDCAGFSYPSLVNINQAQLTGASNTQFCINGGDYVQNGLWYWRVRAMTSTGYSNWSATNYYTWTW